MLQSIIYGYCYPKAYKILSNRNGYFYVFFTFIQDNYHPYRHPKREKKRNNRNCYFLAFCLSIASTIIYTNII